jgi:aconitate hydratase
MNVFDGVRQEFPLGGGGSGRLYSLPRLQERVGPGSLSLSRLPVSLRIVLESLVRNCDGQRVKEEDVRALAAWTPRAERTAEVPFVVARIVLQDFTGVPLLVDLAAMRSAVQALKGDPAVIEPLVPVALVVDHSVQVDQWSTPDALHVNMDIEFRRNRARYEFLKWGMGAFRGFEVVPPGIGIVHQVNLEYLAKGIFDNEGIYYPDSLVGTDSHTTMINGLGNVGWGVGGIEAEAGMLGQPVYFLTPDVVGVHLTGRLSEGATATDLVLVITEMLRKAKVVGKFVEFFGEGAATLAVTDRATVANMAPEYGATMGFFPIDEETCKYLLATGRSREHVDTFRNYYAAQGLFGMPGDGACDYSERLELDLSKVGSSVAGPKRPQDRIPLPQMRARFHEAFARSIAENGYGKDAAALTKRFPAALGRSVATGGGSQKPTSVTEANKLNINVWTESEMANNRPTPDRADVSPETAGHVDVGHGDVLIAAITSCTNTSNPSVMLAAGLLAKNAVERGLRVSPRVKASLAPGSRVVTEYLTRTALQPYLDRLGFNLVGYGCTTCIGNSGPLDAGIEGAVTENDLVTAAVLSGNRNFEARIHQSIKANFLMSPPLVVAFALAGRADIDMSKDPLGVGSDGKPVFLRDIWPSSAEVERALLASVDAATFRRLYKDLGEANPLWKEIPSPRGIVYEWDPSSTYIQEPPFFEGFGPQPPAVTDVRDARALAVFGDSVTTDHISPAGAIKANSPAGLYLQSLGVRPEDFNSYGSRRGNDRVMTRGTFANVRIKNRMVPGIEGGVTRHQPSGETLPIYDASLRYQKEGVPLVVLAGQEYGTGSSRDWAAKGTRLLGVRAVVAQSFERIHRSNLVGMGVLPLQFPDGVGSESLRLDGTEIYDLPDLQARLAPRQSTPLVIRRKDGTRDEVSVRVRIDTPIEVDYYRHGGILPYVLRQLMR